MKKIILLLIITIVFFEVLALRPISVFAQTCDINTCTKIQCLKEHLVCESVGSGIYASDVCHYATYLDWCCKYNVSNLGNCMCCDNYTNECTFNGCRPPPVGGGNNGPTGPICPDGACNGGETCRSCAADCGACPTGDVNIKAVAVPSNTNSCAQVNASTTYIASSMTVYPPGVTKTTPVNGTYASWANQPVTSPFTTYGFSDTPPTGYVYKLACWDRDLPGAISGSGASADLYDGSTINWTVGYTVGAPWFQAQGGDVYAETTIHSYVPSTTVPQAFVKDGSSGSPGVVTYGETANTPYDFDSAGSLLGESSVSSQKWLANETYDTNTDYYAIMFHRFGSPKTPDSVGPTSWDGVPTLPPLNGQAYYVNGNLSIDNTNWTVGTGQSIIILVNGNLTLNTQIHITGTGFVAFIVNGDITVGSSVGATAASTTSVLDGVYITSPSGTFHTGASTTAAARKFIGKGTFVAGDFSMERDLDADGQNNNYPSELFIYNPQLLVTMPDTMRDLPITWQEVAP